MSNQFSVTTPSNTVLIGANRQGKAVFTVTNLSGRLNRGRVRVVPQNTNAALWLTLEGEAERDFQIAGTQQFSVAVNIPPHAQAGGYVFHLEVVGVENPDEDLSQGPSVTFEAPAAPEPPKIPWWIFAAGGVALLVIIGILIAVLSPRSTTVPDVSGMTQQAAQRLLEADGFKIQGVITQPSSVLPKDLVLGSDPPAGSQAAAGAGIQLILSSGPLATFTPTPTATPTATPTVVITSTPTRTATATATITLTPVTKTVYTLNYASVSQKMGGGGNGGFPYSLICPKNSVVTGFQGTSGGVVDTIALECSQLAADGTLSNPQTVGLPGGKAGSPVLRSACPANKAIIGIKGRSGTLVDQVSGLCASLTIPDPRDPVPSTPIGGNGGGEFPAALCDNNYVVTGITGRSGSNIDQISIQCTLLDKTNQVIP